MEKKEDKKKYVTNNRILIAKEAIKEGIRDEKLLKAVVKQPEVSNEIQQAITQILGIDEQLNKNHLNNIHNIHRAVVQHSEKSKVKNKAFV